MDSIEPEVGAPLTGVCSKEDTDPSTTLSFSKDILSIFRGETTVTRGCTCHNPAVQSPIGFQRGGLDLTSYESLRRGGINSKSRIVVPGDPCASIIVQKVSIAPPFGSRMPLNGPPYLSQEEQTRIHDWIAEGANDN